MESIKTCPINLEPIHCVSCFFYWNKNCSYEEITKHPQSHCATCGAPTYDEFRETGRPHICKEEGR